MSQLPPCSRGGTVRAASLATRSKSAPRSVPSIAFSGLGSAASGGIAGFQGGPPLSTSAVSRVFHVASSSFDGAQPISPGCGMPAKRTPGMWRDWA